MLRVPTRRRAFTLVELLVVIVIIGVLAALLIPAIAKALHRSKVSSCASNLSQLYKLQNVYMSKFGGPQRYMPFEQGMAFWEKLAKVQPPLLDFTQLDLLKCPLYDEPEVEGDQEQRQGLCHYYGPVSNINRAAEGIPIGCDAYENHGGTPPGSNGGNILRKSGDVVEDNGELWNACAKSKLKCKP
jgi:prepilin-type N-terminal cleavage/methylation domain-containing protein